MKNIISIFTTLFLIVGCGDFNETLDFTEVNNPNLSESSVVGQPNSATLWKMGIERDLSRTLNEILILAELGSDNYANTQTYYSQFLDELDIRTTDPDIRDTQNQIARIAKMAKYGLSDVGPGDPEYTKEIEAEFHFFLGLSRLYAAMYFSKLPDETLGVPKDSDTNYSSAITSFASAISINEKPEYHLAHARAQYYLGKSAEAVTAAKAALALDADFLRSADFDEKEGPSNTMESALYERGTFDDFQPLPTLDFLDPKYSYLSADLDPSVHIFKAEEAPLILAESYHADNKLTDMKDSLNDLLSVIEDREVREIDDTGETRGDQDNAVDDDIRPSNASDTVNGRSGLVLDRLTDDVSIPSVSGTSLKSIVITSMAIDDSSLELIYRTRQEVFIAEGIRFVDMGVKLVINENEILQNDNVKDGDPGTTPVIPSFINAVKTKLDAFSYDKNTNTATTEINVNAILVANKSDASVLPFH